MSRNAKKRERLFDRFAKNLALIDSDAPDVIGCPICRCTLTRDDLLGENPRVTLAHTFPQSIGGRSVCLSCATCNNTVGTRFEAALSHERELADWWNGKLPLRVRGSGVDSDVALEIQFSPDRESLDVRQVEKHTNPDKWQDLTVNPPTMDSPLSLQIPSPENNDIIVASIHSAYLHLFYHFGYEYVLNENVDLVRKLLLGEKSPLEFRYTVRVLPRPPKAPDALSAGIHILSEPSQFACFLVFQPFADQSNLFRVVAMPGFRPNGKSAYSKFLNTGNSLQNYRAVTLDCLPEVGERLTNPRYRGIGHSYWDKILGIGDGPPADETGV